jgi:hypothetical protein
MLTHRWWSLVAEHLEPVRYREIPVAIANTKTIQRTIQHWHLAPFPEGMHPAANQVFMTWGKPYVGTMEEYIAIKRIADIVANMPPHVYGNIDLLTAVAEYKRAQRRYS